MKKIVTIIAPDLVTNSLLSSFCLSYKPKTEIRFSASWWSGNEKYFFFLFIASRALLESPANSIDFYKGIFLHLIPVRIIVPCFYL